MASEPSSQSWLPSCRITETDCSSRWLWLPSCPWSIRHFWLLHLLPPRIYRALHLFRRIWAQQLCKSAESHHHSSSSSSAQRGCFYSLPFRGMPYSLAVGSCYNPFSATQFSTHQPFCNSHVSYQTFPVSHPSYPTFLSVSHCPATGDSCLLQKTEADAVQPFKSKSEIKKRVVYL